WSNLTAHCAGTCALQVGRLGAGHILPLGTSSRWLSGPVVSTASIQPSYQVGVLFQGNGPPTRKRARSRYGLFWFRERPNRLAAHYRRALHLRVLCVRQRFLRAHSPTWKQARRPAVLDFHTRDRCDHTFRRAEAEQLSG